MKLRDSGDSLQKKVPAWPALVLGALMCVALVQCSLLEPSRPDTHFFILSSTVRDPEPSPFGTNFVLGLGPIHFPAYLRRTEMVTRVGQNRVQISESNRWAEPLDVDFREVLARNLAYLLRTEQVVTYPWYNSTHVDYQVEISVDQFENDAYGTAHLAAQWSVRSARNAALVSRTTSLSVKASGTDSAARVAALSEALGELSREIARAILELHTKERSQPTT